ncbi:hypothetical protein CJ483_23960 [Bacillus sp. PK3_68]|nr:hypothetical protein CJ483_23960 [Bacillus sp. PK3_68]
MNGSRKKKRKRRLYSYIELCIVCILGIVLTFIFNWPRYPTLTVIGGGFLIQMLSIEIKNRD